jgi:SPP1 gp7 family putative phage head morphogenesis protein
VNKHQFAVLAAHARAHGHHQKALPRQAEPLAQQRRYATRIKRRVLEDAMKLVRQLLVPHLEDLAALSSKVGQTSPVHDASDRELDEIIDEIRDRYFEEWSRKEFVKVVRPVAVEVADFDAVQLNKQLSAALGEAMAVDVVGDEPWLNDAIADFTRENVALLKSIPEQFFTELEKTLSADIADGARWEDMAADVEDRYGVASSRAELIARDQVGKFNGDLNRVRQTDLGITKFVWRTMGDERVREEHQQRNGQSYEWSDPPDGETPGEPISCRCYAEPDVLSAIDGD